MTTAGTVTKNTGGTMDEADEQAKAALAAEDKTPDGESKVSSKDKPVEEPKLYSQRELDSVIHATKSDIGRTIKSLEDERDELKKTITARETDVEDIQDERDTIQKELEDLTSGDPAKWEITQKRKDLRDAEKLLKTAKEELANEQKAGEARIKSANETLLEIAIWDIAAEFKGGDPVKLKQLCTTLGVTDENKLREVAENLWDKAEVKQAEVKPEGEKSEEEKKKALKLDSGSSHGGETEKSEEQRLKERYPKMYS